MLFRQMIVEKQASTSDNKRNRRRPFKEQGTAIRQPKFEGKCEELKGDIYDCSDPRQSDTFVKTTKEIAEYVGRTFKYGSDARLAVENLSMPVMTEPNDPADTASKTQVRIWGKKVDKYVKRETYLSENMKTMYSLVWGQCTDVMRQKVETISNFELISGNGDGLALLQAIKDLVYNFQCQKYLLHALHESKRHFYFCVQGKYAMTSVNLEQFQTIIDVIKHSGGSIRKDPGILKALAAKQNKIISNLNAVEFSKLKSPETIPGGGILAKR
jgi:hypothetical protein